MTTARVSSAAPAMTPCCTQASAPASQSSLLGLSGSRSCQISLASAFPVFLPVITLRNSLCFPSCSSSLPLCYSYLLHYLSFCAPENSYSASRCLLIYHLLQEALPDPQRWSYFGSHSAVCVGTLSPAPAHRFVTAFCFSDSLWTVGSLRAGQ